MTALSESRSTKESENKAKSGRREAQQMFGLFVVKFIYSEKATKFCKISTNYLSYVCTASQIIGGDFAKICGLLRICEL